MKVGVDILLSSGIAQTGNHGQELGAGFLMAYS